MSQDRLDASYFSPDICDFIAALHACEVRYLIVGGEAVIYYGHARYTGDVDFFYSRDAVNAQALFSALTRFWGGDVPDMSGHTELMEPGMIIQFGRPPHRIDLLNHIDGVEFEEAYRICTIVELAFDSMNIPLRYLSLEHLIRNKAASGRPKDIEDLRYLRKLRGGE